MRERKEREHTQQRLSSVNSVQVNSVSSVSRDSYTAGLFYVTLMAKEHGNSLSDAVLCRALQRYVRYTQVNTSLTNPARIHCTISFF